jgi:hypothetical protein
MNDGKRGLRKQPCDFDHKLSLSVLESVFLRSESRNGALLKLFVLRSDSMRTDFGSISEALIASGYTALDEQAKALGLHRSTTWTIIKKKHKLGRLSAKTINRILTNPQTPAAVRTAVRQYAVQRCKTATVSFKHMVSMKRSPDLV